MVSPSRTSTWNRSSNACRSRNAFSKVSRQRADGVGEDVVQHGCPTLPGAGQAARSAARPSATPAHISRVASTNASIRADGRRSACHDTVMRARRDRRIDLDDHGGGVVEVDGEHRRQRDPEAGRHAALDGGVVVGLEHEVRLEVAEGEQRLPVARRVAVADERVAGDLVDARCVGRSRHSGVFGASSTKGSSSTGRVMNGPSGSSWAENAMSRSWRSTIAEQLVGVVGLVQHDLHLGALDGEAGEQAREDLGADALHQPDPQPAAVAAW